MFAAIQDEASTVLPPVSGTGSPAQEKAHIPSSLHSISRHASRSLASAAHGKSGSQTRLAGAPAATISGKPDSVTADAKAMPYLQQMRSSRSVLDLDPNHELDPAMGASRELGSRGSLAASLERLSEYGASMDGGEMCGGGAFTVDSAVWHPHGAIRALADDHVRQRLVVDRATAALDDAYDKVEAALYAVRGGTQWYSRALCGIASAENDTDDAAAAVASLSELSRSAASWDDESNEDEDRPSRGSEGSYSAEPWRSSRFLNEDRHDDDERFRFAAMFQAIQEKARGYLVDHDELACDAADVGNPNLVILPFIAPLSAVMHDLFETSPVVLADFDQTTDGNKPDPPPRAALAQADAPPVLGASSHLSAADHAGSHIKTVVAVVQPAAITFTNYVPGQIYSHTVDIVNTSKSTIAVAIDPRSPALQWKEVFHVAITPSHTAFTAPPPTFRLAPGLHRQLTVMFRPGALADYSAPLRIVAQSVSAAQRQEAGHLAPKQMIRVDIGAARPPPLLSGWPTVCQLPVCIKRAGATVSRTLTVRNDGGEASFTAQVLTPAPSTGMTGHLALSPTVWALATHQEVDITLTYTYSSLEAAAESTEELEGLEWPVLVRCDNGSEQSATVIAPLAPSSSEIQVLQSTVALESYPGIPEKSRLELHNPSALALAYEWALLSAPTCPSLSPLDPPNPSAFSILPRRGVIQPGDAVRATVSFTATALAQYSAVATLNVFQAGARAFPASTKAAVVLATKTVTLEGICRPMELAVTPPCIKVLGALAVGQTTAWHLTITNPARVPAHVAWSVQWTPASQRQQHLDSILGVRIIDPESNTAVPPGGKRTIAAVFTGNWPGTVLGSLVCTPYATLPRPGGHDDSDDSRTPGKSVDIPFEVDVGPVTSLAQVSVVGGHGSATDAIDLGLVPVGTATEPATVSLSLPPLMQGRIVQWAVHASSRGTTEQVDDGHGAAAAHAVISCEPSSGTLAPGSTAADICVKCIPILASPTPQSAVLVITFTTTSSSPTSDRPGHVPTATMHIPIAYACAAPSLDPPRFDTRHLAVSSNDRVVVVWRDHTTEVPMMLTNPGSVTTAFRMRVMPQASSEPARKAGCEQQVGTRWGYVPAGGEATVALSIQAPRRDATEKGGGEDEQLSVRVLVESDPPGFFSHVCSFTAVLRTPTLTASPPLLDFGSLAIFGWQVQTVRLVNPTSVPLPFAVPEAHAPISSAWQEDDGSAATSTPLASATTQTLVPQLTALAARAVALANGARGAAAVVLPPSGTVPAGGSVEVGVWCIVTGPGTHALQVPITRDRSGPGISVRVAAAGSPLWIESPVLDRARRVLAVGGRAGSVPMHITNLAPYPVTAVFGLLAWSSAPSGREPAEQRLKQAPPPPARVRSAETGASLTHASLQLIGPSSSSQVEAPANTDKLPGAVRVSFPPRATRVVHVQHRRPDSHARYMHGVVVHEMVPDHGRDDTGWQAAVRQSAAVMQSRPGSAGLRNAAGAYLKRAVLQWAMCAPGSAMYVSGGEGGTPREPFAWWEDPASATATDAHWIEDEDDHAWDEASR
ncbi:hypothetical protein BC828DRAFT_407770 [Blastocladiella britannica]|nr:hypothetical protein BC828DRAFT_407770 [Blastocladiella britannica]